jgi:hypothetical protein
MPNLGKHPIYFAFGLDCEPILLAHHPRYSLDNDFFMLVGYYLRNISAKDFWGLVIVVCACAGLAAKLHSYGLKRDEAIWLPILAVYLGLVGMPSPRRS